MFDMLADRLGKAVDSLRGRGRLTEENVADTLRQVRMALLEADVAVAVLKSFTDAVRARAVGTEVMKSLTPGQAFIRIIHEELTRVMGEPGRGINLRAAPPVVVLLAGLQGAGKTTTAAKLARHLIKKHRRKPLLASTDIYSAKSGGKIVSSPHCIYEEDVVMVYPNIHPRVHPRMHPDMWYGTIIVVGG